MSIDYSFIQYLYCYVYGDAVRIVISFIYDFTSRH
jgi:hypothetical protein